jgi:stage II sporulation protein E
LARPFLAECALGAGLFLLLPGKAFGGKRVRRGDGETAVPIGNLLRERLDKVAVALRDLHDCMGRTVPASGEENPAVVFDRAAEKVCRDCALCSLCWQKEYTGTFNALNDATPTLLERGRAMAKDFPGYFSSRCIHLPDFIMEVNNEFHDRLIYTFDMLNNRSYYLELLDMQRPQADLEYPRVAFEHAPVPDQYDPDAVDSNAGSIFEEMMDDFGGFDGDSDCDDEW